MRRFSSWYGANPLHLLALLASFALAGYAALRLVPINPLKVAAWFVGGIVLHDLVLLPLYTLADRSAAAVLRHDPLRLPGRTWLNHLRVPVVLSAMLFLAFFPLILKLPGSLRNVLGHEQPSFLLHWLLISAILFAGSAVILAVRIGRRSPVRGQQVLNEESGTGLDG